MLNVEELVEYFSNGLSFLNVRKDSAQAAQWFEYAIGKCESEGETPPVDLYRGVAACTQDRVASFDDVLRFHQQLDTWGALSIRAFRKLGNTTETDEMLRTQPPLDFDLHLWDLRVKVTTLPDVFAAAAWATVKVDRDFGAAKAIIDDARRRGMDTEITTLVEALIYYESGRWHDATVTAARLSDARDRDIVDQFVGDGEGGYVASLKYQIAGRIITGAAWAHLGSREAAHDALDIIVGEQFRGAFPALSAAACLTLGLLERQYGHEDKAQLMFGRGATLSPSAELSAAKDDPKVMMRVTSQAMIERRGSYWDRGSEPSLEHERAAQANEERAELLRAAEEELDMQIGMTEVKDQVNRLRRSVLFARERERRGLPTPPRTNHLVFSGPPGTGKTTIARVVANLFAGMGITRNATVVEVQRTDLVDQYEGHTGQKTDKKIADALGGVLFIDEAYGLIHDRGDGKKDPFGQEVVDRLLVALEEYRHDLIVIIAGYEGDLRRFLATNQGLKSRFANWIKFPSYSAEELAQIAQVHAGLRHNIMSDDAVSQLANYVSSDLEGLLDASQKPLLDTLGNGRFMRLVVEGAETYRDERLSDFDMESLSDEAMRVLTAEDLLNAARQVVTDEAQKKRA